MPLKVGIRSFDEGFGEGMEDEMDRFLDLGPLLLASQSDSEPLSAERRIFGEQAWNGRPRSELIEFVHPFRRLRCPIELHLAAHGSVAYTVGWVLEAKSGLDLRTWQRGPGPGRFFLPADGEVPEGPLRTFEKEVLDPEAKDVAVAISITHPVGDDVRACLRSAAGPKVGRLIHATVAGGTGQKSVRSGAHALRLAQTLARRIQSRNLAERQAPLHLFWSAPNAFAVHLGQQSRAFGRVRLYEYPFGNADPAGVYWPSIALPPEAE